MLQLAGPAGSACPRQGDRLEEDWVPTEDGRAPEEVEEETRKAEATNRAVVLEMIGARPRASPGWEPMGHS